jgi:hypothetical protein
MTWAFTIPVLGSISMLTNLTMEQAIALKGRHLDVTRGMEDGFETAQFSYEPISSYSNGPSYRTNPSGWIVNVKYQSKPDGLNITIGIKLPALYPVFLSVLLIHSACYYTGMMQATFNIFNLIPAAFIFSFLSRFVQELIKIRKSIKHMFDEYRIDRL